jgi:hypothetical protein
VVFLWLKLHEWLSLAASANGTRQVCAGWDIVANLVERDREIGGKRARELCTPTLISLKQVRPGGE